MSSATPSFEFETLLKAVEDDVIHAYRDKYFPEHLIQACPTIYTIENASKWINVDKFYYFVAQYYQQKSPPSSPSNTSARGVSRATATTSTTIMTQESDEPSLKRTRRTSITPTPPDERDNQSEDSEDGAAPSGSRKKKRVAKIQNFSKARQSEKHAAGLIQITRQSWVHRIELLTEIPEHWEVPEPSESIAYIMDLSDDPNEYLDAKGMRMAMSAIIKQKCTDAWAGGTGGSLLKATSVMLLHGGIKCQRMMHECRGAFICSRAPIDLWKDYKRGDPEPEEHFPSPSTAAEHPEETHTGFERPLAFYNNVVKEKCQFNDGRCSGRLELKHETGLHSVSGSQFYVGCSSLTVQNDVPGHFIRPVPKDVDEGILMQLFRTGRVNYSDTVVADAPCTFAVPPRTGFKQKLCPHLHIQKGKIVDAPMRQRPCKARIAILSPLNHAIPKAIVIPAPGLYHNHPFYPWDKRSRREIAAEKAAARVESIPDSDDDGVQ